MNRNVSAALFFSFMIALSETSWGYAALSGYLFEVGHDNKHVGLAEGFQGIAQLAAALIAGRIADKQSRQLPLRVGALVGLVAICTMWFAMFAPVAESSDSRAFALTALGLTVWGTFRGTTMSPLDALFADSISTQERAQKQVWKYVATLVGATSGPLLASIMFMQVGDSWTRTELKYVIAAGTAVAIIPLASLLLLRDKHALHEDLSGPLLDLQSSTIGIIEADEESNSINIEHEKLATRVRQLCFAADALFGVASGMTIKFFPLFFRDNTHLTPSKVNLVTICTTAFMIVFSLLAQRLAAKYSRMRVILCCKFMGISLLFVMSQYTAIWSDWRIIVPIYIARTVLMNCTAPLHKSILMDHCPKSTRGRWNAADSIVSFGWSGSAFLGGILADAHGFGFSFLITAILQFIGMCLLTLLLPLVKDEREEEQSVMDEEEVLVQA